MRDRRLAFVVDSDAWGGAEAYVAHLVRRAPEHGWRASLVCASPVAERLTAASGLSPQDVGEVPLARRELRAPAVLDALRAARPDVVHVNLVDPASNAAVLAAALRVAPTVATLHLPGDTDAAAGGRPALAALFARLASVLAPSEQARRQVVDGLGVAPGRALRVPNGVDLPAGPPGPAGCCPVRVGVVSRLTEQKGVDVLLAAVRRLVACGVELEVVVAGAGRDADALAAAARGLPVRFAGFVADVPAFLRGVDAFCLPSRREAMPLALLEAMAHGLPCVATDVGAVRSSVGPAALVVPPEDPAALAGALAALVTYAPLRAELGARARRRAEERFDAATMATRTYDVIAAAVEPAAA